MNIVLESLDIPQWAQCFIEYGDGSGLSDEDEALVTEWLNAVVEEHGAVCFAWGSVNEFCTQPEFGLACGTFNTDVLSA